MAVRDASHAASDRRASSAYRVAFLDWLACAVAGRDEPAAQAARSAGDGLLDRVAAAGAAGHVLDFDDTWTPGLAHLSSAAAPAALVLGAERGATVGDVLGAHAAGFEAAGAVARASHPALYDAGWHPTAMCGAVGAAAAAARLIGLDADRGHAAAALALLGTSGVLAAFGSDGKALQVGIAAAAGVRGATLAAVGAGAPDPGRVLEAFSGRWAQPDPAASPAVDENWIKAYPCCLQTHAAIEAALEVRGTKGSATGAPLVVAVHPLSRRAAPYDHVEDGLQAKFSIPYLTAFALLNGAPRVQHFDAVDDETRAFAAEHVRVRTDPTLDQSEARVERDRSVLARVVAPLGSPGRPMDETALAAKVSDLAGDSLAGLLDDPSSPAEAVLDVLES